MPIVKNAIVKINPDKLSGAPGFCRDRVPVKNLFDYLEGVKRWKIFSKVSRPLRANKRSLF
jgi:hypothetical protein